MSFGCVLNDTTMTKAVRVTNNSVVDCTFSWSFLEDVDEGRLSATARRPYIPVNQIFDILPIRSFLRPGESEEVRALRIACFVFVRLTTKAPLVVSVET